MKKTALITGITGQDGSYLAKLLLSKDYAVHGVIRASENKNNWRHKYLNILEEITLHECDLENKGSTTELVSKINPNEIYNLAAQSSVTQSKQSGNDTIHFNTTSVHNLLKSVLEVDKHIKFFQASSSEIFDPLALQPLTTTSPINPTNSYGVSKAISHKLVQKYRQDTDIFAVNGILFQHESPLRHSESLIKVLIKNAESIKNTGKGSINLGQSQNKRDYGNAEDYVQAMWLSLQADKPDDYIISSGLSVSIEEITLYILKKFNLPSDLIVIDEKLFRFPNSPIIYGDNTLTKKSLGWSSTIDIFETIDQMIEFQRIISKY